MSADGTINIDILLNKKEEFLNDAKKIDEILKALGKNTGEQMDASFTNEAKTLETKAKNTKKVIDLTFEKPVEVEIKADVSKANKEVETTKKTLKKIPKNKSTKINVDNKNAISKVKEADKQIDKIPNKKKTKIGADTKEVKEKLKELDSKVEESERTFSKLKEIIGGTFVGMVAAKGVEKVTSSLSGWIEQIGAVQDAHIKLKNTLGLSEEQTKRYAAVTRGLFTSGYVDSIEDAAEVVASLNAQLGDMPSGDMARITRYATILRDQFDMDLNESLRGINSLITNFGLSADAAFDYMVKGAQRGLDKTDELGDNLAEYGQIWSQAGFDAKSMFGILENGLKSGAYNLDKVNDFVKEFTISLNDGRIEENLNSFSDDTKQLFNQFKTGKATASDVFKSVISDLKNTQNQQEKLSTASTIWSALGEDNAMKVIESLGDVNDAYENVSGTAAKTAEETEKSFSMRFKSAIREVEISLIPVGNKILDITEKYLPSFGEVSGKVFVGIYDSVDKVCSYLDSHKKIIVDIIDNGKKILGIVADTAWTVFKDILNLISGFLGDVNENGKKVQDPLQQIDDILTNLAKHKDEIERVTKIVLAMWATKKIFAFISAVKEAKKALMELKAVELITGDGGLLNFKGLKIGKGTNKAAKGAEEVLEGAEAVKSLTKLGKVGEVAKGGLKTAGRGIAGLDVLFSLFELVGINKNNAGKKVGAATGSLGGTVAGGVAGATIGSTVPVIGTAVGGVIGAGLGALGGTALGKKLGEEIQKGLEKSGIKKNLNSLFSNLGWSKKINKPVQEVTKTFDTFGKEISHWWSKNGQPLEKSIINFSQLHYHIFEPSLKMITGLFSGTWGGIIRELKIVWETIKKIIDGGIKIIEGILDVFIGVFTGNWSKAWEGIKSIFSGGLEIIGGLLKAGKDTLGNIALTIGEAIGNAVIGGINGLIDGIDWVSEKLTGHKTKIHYVDKLKLTKNEKGTKHHPGGLMMVNDQKGDTYEELIIPKSGNPYIPKGRDVILNEEVGTQVVPAPLTKMMVDFGLIPRFEKGTGFWSEVWESTKDIVGDIMDYASHPSKLINIAVNKFANVKSDAKEVIDLGWGGIKYLANQAVDWVKSLFASKSGSFDGALNGNGVYQYLVDIANQAISKFGMSGITSGYRPGDKYWHGKHQAIDIAYPASMNYSGKYFEPANWIFDNFADKVGYVITQGKVRDRTGQSGQPATGVWETWPDNDHYDHLHITGKLVAGEISKGASGSGAERWRGQVIKAANMVGFPTDKAHIDHIIAQIQTESGGNEKAVQGNIGDINNITGDLAKGLMQTISATFNAYKVSGHDNIFNGFDNILAALRYIMSRYGVGSGFFANIGIGHGYANGGWASIPSVFGEVPGQPEVAINPKRDTADELIIEAINARTKEAPHSLTAKISKVLQSAKQDMQSILPESSRIPTSNQSIASRYTTIKANRNMEHGSDRAVNLLSEMLKATKEQTIALINQPAPMVDGHSFFKEGAAMIHQTQMTYQNSANRRRGIVNN